jgi:hypothetical protein
MLQYTVCRGTGLTTSLALASRPRRRGGIDVGRPVAFLSVLSAESRFHGVLANALTKFLPTGPVLRPIFARCPIETQNSDSVGRDRSYN